MSGAVLSPEAPKAAPTPIPAGATPTPTPSPSPEPAPDKPEASSPQPAAKVEAPKVSSPFDELDELSGMKKKEPNEKKSDDNKTVEEGKLADGKPQTPEEPKQGGSAKELRTALENAKKEAQSLKAELERIRTGKTEDPERKTLQEKLAAESKRREEIELNLRFSNYEKSDEYKEKFVKPMESAFQTAYDEIKTIQIKQADGSVVQATPNHFNHLLHLNIQEAAAQAKEWFGEAAPEFMAYRRKVLDMNKDRQEAIERYKKEGAEREQKTEAERIQQAERVQSLWLKTNEVFIEKHKEHLTPKEGDDAGNELLQKGFELSDLAFANDPNIPVEKRVALHAMVRNRAAAYDRLVHQNKSQAERIAALEKELEGFRDSVPTTEKVSDGTPVPSNGKALSWDQEIDQLARVKR